MENLRQQYEAHLRHKDEQLQAFVDEFNRYQSYSHDRLCIRHINQYDPMMAASELH
jgi:hypothetical protein